MYPKADEATAEQLSGIGAYLDGWYGALDSEAPYAEDLGLSAYVDMDSLVDFVLLQELLRNNDAYYLSVHLWKERGGRLHFVPWDLDLSLGQPDYNDNENPEGWILYRPDWVSRMTADPDFGSVMTERWWELRQGLFSETMIESRLDRYLSSLEPGLERNFEIWPMDTIQFAEDALYEVSSHEEEMDRLRTFIRLRTAWIDEHIDTY